MTFVRTAKCTGCALPPQWRRNAVFCTFLRRLNSAGRSSSPESVRAGRTGNTKSLIFTVNWQRLILTFWNSIHDSAMPHWVLVAWISKQESVPHRKHSESSEKHDSNMSEINTQQTRDKGEYEGSPYFSESQTKHWRTIYRNIQTAALQTKRRNEKTQLTKTKLVHSYHCCSTLCDPFVTKLALPQRTDSHTTQ
jgi:hypothetical protein